MEAAEEFVRRKITSKKVVVFSKSWCPFCVKVKNVLAQHKIKPDQYETVELEDNPDCAKIQDYLNDFTGGRTVPRVFICGKFVGGYDDTYNLNECGKLEQMLKECEAV